MPPVNSFRLSRAGRMNLCGFAFLLCCLAVVSASFAQRTSPPPNTQRRGIQVPRLVELTFATVSSITMKYTEKGGTTLDLYGTDLTAHLVWQAPAGNNFTWRWQAAVQPFSGEINLSPPGLVAQEDVLARTFMINFANYPPLNATTGRVSRSRPQSMDFYIRMVAINNGQPVLASNVVVAHYRLGRNSSEDVLTKAMKDEADKKAKLEALKKTYIVEIISFKPAIFPDPNQWGCVVITKNENSLLKAAYPPG